MTYTTIRVEKETRDLILAERQDGECMAEALRRLLGHRAKSADDQFTVLEEEDDEPSTTEVDSAHQEASA